MRLHTGAKPFPCTYCDKTFGHMTDKKRHEYTHTGNYPYKCDSCQRGFVKLSGYEAHIKASGSGGKCRDRRERPTMHKADDKPGDHDMGYELIVVNNEATQEYGGEMIELEVIDENSQN